MNNISAHDIYIRAMQGGDIPTVLEIYQQGIETGQATFESAPPTAQEFDRKFMPNARLSAIMPSNNGDIVVGWACLTAVSTRCVYEGVAEVSLYIAPTHQNRGIGFKLLQELIKESENNGIWTLQSSIFPENKASIALHQKAGFRVIGYREKIAYMNIGDNRGQWRDITLLERRSKNIGQ